MKVSQNVRGFKIQQAFLPLLLMMLVHGVMVEWHRFGANSTTIDFAIPNAAAGKFYHSETNPRVVESFVISMNLDHLEGFAARNNHTGMKPLWVPGVDGYHQPTLNMWAQLIESERPPLNASHFIPGLQEHKDKYASPHAVGCYLAHWHLLRMLDGRPKNLRPELYVIFEDDTTCVDNLAPQLLAVSQKLPPDWDMLFVSGKPYITFKTKKSRFNSDWSDDQVERKVCAGRFGPGTGITNPNGSRHLLQSDDYWRVHDMTDTPSYVVNPRRLEHIMKVLKPKKYIPIDVLLSEAMLDGRLLVYMTTLQLCSPGVEFMPEPIPWSGYWTFLTKGDTEYRWRSNGIHVSSNCSI